jgi:hypothetical protein
MILMLKLIDGNGIKSGITLKDLVNEGWVKFVDMDLDYELDTNQLNAVVYQALKWLSMAGRRPRSGSLYERIESESFKSYMKTR